MTVKIGNKEYVFEGYVKPQQSLIHLLNDVYEQGRTDADAFLKQWKDDAVESLAKYDAESVEEVYIKGRADGIEYVRSGRYAKENHKCPICIDCPKNCPVEMSRSNGK